MPKLYNVMMPNTVKLSYFLIAISIISLFIFGDAQLGFSETDYIVNRIDISVKPGSAAVNENANVVYVSDFFAGKLAVINGTNDKIIDYINVTRTSFGVGYNHGTDLIYVGGEFTNIVNVVNEITNIVNVVNEITNMIYITNQETNTVSVIDGVENTITNSIMVGDIPRRIAIHQDTNLIYVTNHGSNDISVIDGYSDVVIKTIPVQVPFEIVMNQKTGKLYSMYYGNMGISVI